jgi:hypothetical protein
MIIFENMIRTCDWHENMIRTCDWHENMIIFETPPFRFVGPWKIEKESNAA